MHGPIGNIAHPRYLVMNLSLTLRIFEFELYIWSVYLEVHT